MKSLRIPGEEYLANLLTAGDTQPVVNVRWNACWPCAPTSAQSTQVASQAVLDQVQQRPTRSRGDVPLPA